MTYIRTWQGWLYLAVVIDLYSRRVIGWSMRSTLARELVLDAILMAVWQRKPKGEVIIHSDQGTQNGSDDWQRFCRSNKLVPIALLWADAYRPKRNGNMPRAEHLRRRGNLSPVRKFPIAAKAIRSPVPRLARILSSLSGVVRLRKIAVRMAFTTLPAMSWNGRVLGTGISAIVKTANPWSSNALKVRTPVAYRIRAMQAPTVVLL
jgi:hypothetical protein